jgi:hypothetical protein
MAIYSTIGLLPFGKTGNRARLALTHFVRRPTYISSGEAASVGDLFHFKPASNVVFWRLATIRPHRVCPLLEVVSTDRRNTLS